MFPVKNFISLATVWNGSILIGASGGGLLMTFCATLYAAAHDDWFRRRGVCHIALAVGFAFRSERLEEVHVERRHVFWCRAMLVASRVDRLVMDILCKIDPQCACTSAIERVPGVFGRIMAGEMCECELAIAQHRKI